MKRWSSLSILKLYAGSLLFSLKCKQTLSDEHSIQAKLCMLIRYGFLLLFFYLNFDLIWLSLSISSPNHIWYFKGPWKGLVSYPIHTLLRLPLCLCYRELAPEVPVDIFLGRPLWTLCTEWDDSQLYSRSCLQ